MKSAAVTAAAVLASAAMAQPHHGHHHHQRRHQHAADKRDYHTEWTTVWETVTVWADETGYETSFPAQATTTEAAATTSSGKPGQFFQAASSSTTLSTSVYVPPVSSSTSTYVAPVPTTTSTTPVATTPTTTYVAPTTTAVAVPTTSSTTAAAAATTSKASSGGSTGGEKSGAMTYYTLGLGSCGYDDSGADDTKNIVAMGGDVWNAISSTLTSYGLNQPAHPLCDQQITVTYNGKSVVGTIRDKCPTCTGSDGIDVSEGMFKELVGSTTAGIVEVEWSYVSFSG